MLVQFMCAASIAAIVPGAPGAQGGESDLVPQWLRAHMEFMVADGGRWIADNAAYRTDQEPFDAYGTEWSWGLGRKSLTGRLFGLSGGREVATFWEFRVVWHPGKKQALIDQYGGDGRLGEGTMSSTTGGTEHEQTFFLPDGSSSRQRHESLESGDENRTESFDWVDGRWVSRRTYVWRRDRG